MTLRGAMCLSLLIVILVQVARAEITLTVSDHDAVTTVIAEEDGHMFERFCEATGDLGNLEALEWLRDGGVVESDVGSQGHLLIEPISLEQAGNYTCRGSLNGGGYTDPVSAGQLVVLDPSVVVAPPTQYVLLNGSIDLVCSFSGMQPTVIWRRDRDDGPVVSGSIEAATQDDERTYFCRLSNPVFTDPVERNIELRVVVPPAITATPDALYEFTADNFTSSISLQFDGRSRDTVVTWMRNSTNLSTAGEGYRIDTSYQGFMEGTTTLVFTEECLSRSLQGQYTVAIAVENDVIPLGERRVQYDFEVRVTALPAPMTDVVVTAQSTTRATVTWSATYCHEDTEPDQFFVIVATDNGTQGTSLSLAEEDWREMEYEVDVDPGTEYWISLRAENQDGTTNSSAVVFESEPDNPSIQNTDVSRINKTAFSITTELDYTGGGRIENFTVSFRIKGEEEWSEDKIVSAEPVPDPDNQKWRAVIVDSSFAVFSEFEFQVALTNTRELTAATGEIQEIQELPGRPVRIEAISTTETTAVLEVELSSQGTPPLFVVMEPTSHTELDVVNMTTYLRGDTVRFLWEGLSKGTTYTVNVYAENLEGRGPGDQASFSTDGQSTLLPLWMIVVICVGGVLLLAILLVLFCLLMCCGYKYRHRKREYYTGPLPVDYTKHELEPANPMITRSTRSNGCAGSTSSLSPRCPTGLSSRSQGFFDDIDGSSSRPFDEGSTTSPYHYKNRFDNLSASEGTPSVVPSTHKLVMGESYSSLPRQNYQHGSQDIVAVSPKTATLSPPPAPKSCATDV